MGIRDLNIKGKTRRITKFDKKSSTRVPVDTIHVQLNNKEEQLRVLEASRILVKSPVFKDIFINRELTINESQREYQLRQEKRERTSKLAWVASDGRRFGYNGKSVFTWCIKFINGRRQVSEFWHNPEETERLRRGASKSPNPAGSTGGNVD
ncbi:hypothetical protein BpHYR1_009422 [Brachionus plicatilis]|uniref:Uncharacterized protein n=1 Tax=Brachionus plicatilis TaxID=10195 RepID=A0A3M7R5Y9_BRAPC|nr:hypothetical protein BpHYR1_009422 [Brachionus plicatilis]